MIRAFEATPVVTFVASPLQGFGRTGSQQRPIIANPEIPVIRDGLEAIDYPVDKFDCESAITLTPIKLGGV